MWPEIKKYFPQFSSVVVTGVDGDGYPYSARCGARIDEAAGKIHLDLRGDHPLAAGPASLLCHQMNEELWDLKGLLVRGALERDGAGWVFRPTKFVPGAGLGGLMKPFLEARRVAAEYLAKRGLSRPVIPWDRIRGAKRAAQDRADELR